MHEDVAYSRTRAAGGRLVRIEAFWNSIQAGGPNSFSWSALDSHVNLLRAHGLQPILDIRGTPWWAVHPEAAAYYDTHSPDPPQTAWWPRADALGAFARKVAERYNGVVYHYTVWNEPNLTLFLGPQYIGSQLRSAHHYRNMINAAADQIHAVNPANVVIAGGTAPFGSTDGLQPGPLLFLRTVLEGPVRFDVWGVHPFTSGAPTRQARRRNDTSLGDLPEVRRTLLNAAAAGRLVSASPVQMWVTEFSWDTKPPDPRGVPTSLHVRWTAEALYRSWRAGSPVVLWTQLRDHPYACSPWQAGLYYYGSGGGAGGVPKPSLAAFRFPFVAFSRNGRVSVWGRTPESDSRRVVIERRTSRGWRGVRTLRATGEGIFSARWRMSWRGKMRARLAGTGTRSAVFSLIPPRTTWEGHPFGGVNNTGGGSC